MKFDLEQLRQNLADGYELHATVGEPKSRYKFLPDSFVVRITQVNVEKRAFLSDDWKFGDCWISEDVVSHIKKSG